MAKKNQNTGLYQGDYREIFVTIKNNDGTSVSTSGKSLFYKIAKTHTTTPVFTDSTNDGIVITEMGGEFTGMITITSEVSQSIAPGSYIHELRLTEDNKSYVVMEGKFNVWKSLINEV